MIWCELAFTVSYSLNMMVRASRRQHTRVPTLLPLVMALQSNISNRGEKKEMIYICLTIGNNPLSRTICDRKARDDRLSFSYQLHIR